VVITEVTVTLGADELESMPHVIRHAFKNDLHLLIAITMTALVANQTVE
jgi:hypothetical protein